MSASDQSGPCLINIVELVSGDRNADAPSSGRAAKASAHSHSDATAPVRIISNRFADPRGNDMDDSKQLMAHAVDAATRGDLQALLLAQNG